MTALEKYKQDHPGADTKVAANLEWVLSTIEKIEDRDTTYEAGLGLSLIDKTFEVNLSPFVGTEKCATQPSPTESF